MARMTKQKLTGRERVTKQLIDISTSLTSKTHDPYYSPGLEDVFDAKYYYMLAQKNAAGTLSASEAREVLEMFEQDMFTNKAVINSTEDGHVWVELVD